MMKKLFVKAHCLSYYLTVIKSCILFQLENLVHSPEEVLRQSMFPRVHPPEDNKFSKW
jgi:tRNA uridine 5-carbamoylmethylation protein Kti12